jgi:hypothetical protein
MFADKKQLLLISPDQFGYHTDDYYRAFYARNDFEVHVLCYDHGKKKIALSDVTVHYITYGHNRLINEINLFKNIRKIVENSNIRIAYTRFFVSCALIKIFNNCGKIYWILDIRTGAVSSSFSKRYIYNKLIKLSSKFFRKITVISDNLAKKLRIKNYSVVPLGGQPLVNEDEIMAPINNMNFIYVGIFDGRRIPDIILAYCRFYRKYSDLISTKLTIIGYSNNSNEETKIKNLIQNNQDVSIDYTGRVLNMELKKYFIESNIGISYVPITTWFDVQPPTKTFEYIVNGLICLATNTIENRKVITESNGVLVQDDEDSAFRGMCEIFELRLNYNRHKIMRESKIYSWENIYKNSLYRIMCE